MIVLLKDDLEITALPIIISGIPVSPYPTDLRNRLDP